MSGASLGDPVATAEANAAVDAGVDWRNSLSER